MLFSCGNLKSTREAVNSSGEKIPDRVWEGGTADMVLELNTNQKAVLKLSFFRDGKGGGDGQTLHVSQNLSPGAQVFKVNVPSNVGGYVELGVPDAVPGAAISCSVKVGGKEIWKGSDTMAQPLEKGTAFFVNVDIEDIAKGVLQAD